MSFVNLLFPVEQLEALGNKWPESATKRRKLDVTSGKDQYREVAVPRRQNSAPIFDQRHDRLPTSSYQHRKFSSSSSARSNIATLKRGPSDSKSAAPAAPTISQPKPTNYRFCLPSFIEPSILKNYLSHLHPKDRPRYSLPPKPKPETHPRGMAPTAISSPGSLTNDHASSPSSTTSEHGPATPAEICDQFRSGPFGHIFEGMRMTDQERNLVEDLLSPGWSNDMQPQSYIPKRKAATFEPELNPDDFYEVDEKLLHRMFPVAGSQKPVGLNSLPAKTAENEDDDDDDAYSSCLSPAAAWEEQQDEEDDEYTSPAGIVIYNHSALSVDDFFDLDGASSPLYLPE